jgi:hypothetical protein
MPFHAGAGSRVAAAASAAAAAFLLIASLPDRALSFPAAARESRGVAKREWQGQSLAIDYGKVAVGSHRLDELRLGETWRMGAGAITTLKTEAPLITVDGVIPPGWFRASVGRPEEQRFALKLDGAGRWMAVGGDDVLLDGELSFADPPGRTLDVTLRPATEQADPELQALSLSIEFGAPRLTVPLILAGGVTKKTGGATVTWFKLPTTWLEQRLELAKLTPIATVVLAKPAKGQPAVMNLLLSDTMVRLVPQVEPPTADGGFGPLPELLVEHDLVGTVSFAAATEPDGGAASDSRKAAPPAAPPRHLVVDEVAVTSKKSEPPALRLVLRVGPRRAEVTVPLGRDPRESRSSRSAADQDAVVAAASTGT